jgi:excisionase family DNA binding protein
MSKIRGALLRALTEEVSVPVEVAGEALGIGRNSAYSAIKSGEIPSVRIGRRVVVPTAAIRKMLQIEEPHRA